MKKIFISLVGATALALPASAFAHGNHHGGHGGRHYKGLSIGLSIKGSGGDDDQGESHSNSHASSAQQLSGTGTSFGAATASVTGTGFTASLATTWSSATTMSKPDDDGDNDATTAGISCAPSTASLTIGTAAADTFTGKTCSYTNNGTTLYAFYGTDTSGAHALLKESGTTVTGAVFSGNKGMHFGVFAGAHMGNCDNH